MNLFNFIFKNKKSEHKDLNVSESIKGKIVSAIQICKNDLRSEKNKLFEFKTIAKKLIADIYFVPSEYWYDELNFLSKIKSHSENKNIDPSVLTKTDNLLNEYFQQIKLCESKIHFLNSLLLKYETLLKKVENTIHKTLMLKNKEEYIKALKKYKGKLNTVLENNEDLNIIYEESEHLKIIRDEINEIGEDFSVQKEVTEYLHKISSEFEEDVETSDTEILRKEISKLNKEINKREDNDNQ